MYSTQCIVCKSFTNTLMRAQAEHYKFNAPDGVEATVVENTPDSVTFFVPKGQYHGYYKHNKFTNRKELWL